MNLLTTDLTVSIFAILLICVLLYLIWLVGGRFIWALVSPGWPTVTGRVLNSNETYKSFRAGRIYFVNVEYAYSVNGVRYSGNHQKMCGSLKDAQAELIRYQLNQEIVIYYNPENNNISVLEPGIKILKQEFIFMLAMIVGLFLAFLLKP